MDEIQKILIQAGRKDLAQKYYKKIAEKLEAKEMASIFNSKLSGIGGNTTNFLNYDLVKKAFDEKPEMLEDKDILSLVNSIEKLYKEYWKTADDYKKKGTELRRKAEKLLSEKFEKRIY